MLFMGSYDNLLPYPLEYMQAVSSSLHTVTYSLLGDSQGMHLGTAVAGLGVVAGMFGASQDGAEKDACILMGTAVAWGKMLGLQGMEDVPVVDGHYKPRLGAVELAEMLRQPYSDNMVDQGAARSTWGTLLIVSAMDLVYQSKNVIEPSIPKTIIIGAIADGARIAETGN